MRRVATLVVCVWALAASGCGYALAGRGSFLPATIRTVGIPKLDNRTTFFQVEDMLTDKIRAEFIGRGKYAVSPDAAGADAVLTGMVLGISVTPVGFNEQQLASRYLFTLAMRVEFTEPRHGRSSGRTTPGLPRRVRAADPHRREHPTATSFLDQERSSIDRIATDVARTVVTAILEAF